MRINIHLPVTVIGAAFAFAMGSETPICEEFAGESNISCVASDTLAVITSQSATGRSYEFFKGHRKAYLELSTDGAILASSGIRTLNLPAIPSDSTERYISEILEGILDDISWK